MFILPLFAHIAIDIYTKIPYDIDGSLERTKEGTQQGNERTKAGNHQGQQSYKPER
jgi:hypothetical protein